MILSIVVKNYLTLSVNCIIFRYFKHLSNDTEYCIFMYINIKQYRFHVHALNCSEYHQCLGVYIHESV